MLQYFTIRPTHSDASDNLKRWLYKELKAGRLRQGWFGELPLVTAQGKVVLKDEWVKRARTLVSGWTWPNPSERDRFGRESFCPEKYEELNRMTEIREGDCVVVPSMDSIGGKAGFLLTTADVSRRQRSRNCYWYDKGRIAFEAYRHVLTVRVTGFEPSEFSNAHYSSIAEKLTHAIKPVQKIKSSDLLEELAPLRGKLQPITSGTLGRFELRKEKLNRKTIEKQIAARQGQGEFRQSLLSAYERRCAISDCDVVEVLEAAHIVPHNISASDDPRNGILLRADLHTLLDEGLLAINPLTRRVELHPTVRANYAGYEGREIKQAVPPFYRPHVNALKHQYRRFREIARS
jgi:hypothetical protein